MLSLGEKLRRTRVEKGLEITALAARTKISAKFLDAIEGDRRDLLPAGFFFRNWAVQYARALSLDETEIQADIDQILSAEAPLPLPGQVRAESKDGPRWYPKIPRLDGARSLGVSISFLLAVVLACSGLYTWWHREKQVRETYAMLPHTVNTESSVKPPESAPRSTMLNRQSTNARAPEATPVGDAPSGDTPEALLLELHAREQTWLVISPDGKQIFNGVLQANESKTVEAHETARIKVGNAGGLDVRLNGKPVGELGPRGKVRVLLVGPEGVRIFHQSRSGGEPGNSPIAAITPSEAAFDGGAALRLTLQE